MIREATIWILILTAGALAIWDTFAAIKGGSESTISRVLYEKSKAHPIISFILGLLLGHVFWPNN